MTEPIIAPSLLSANFGNLSASIKEVVDGGADWLHLDVMDGHFVPNLTFGPLIVEAVRRITNLYLDVHLMITPPEPYLEAFARAGADGLTIHAEATAHSHRAIQYIKSLGLKAGIAINPGTSWQTIEPLLPEVDLVLVMTVNPGFAGQKLIPSALDKLRQLARYCRTTGASPLLQVDGGIDENSVAAAVSAGAQVLVAGSSVFGAPSPAEAVRRIRQAALSALGVHANE